MPHNEPISWRIVPVVNHIFYFFREELQLSILAPVRYQEEFSSLGLPASSGVLLIGQLSLIVHFYDVQGSRRKFNDFHYRYILFVRDLP